jgi:hypothetical protein
MLFLKRLLPMGAVFLMLLVVLHAEPASGEPVSSRNACATVTFVRGAPMLTEGGGEPRHLVKGQALCSGAAVRTDGISRIELTLSGGGVVRLAEDTSLELEKSGLDMAASGGQLQLRFLKGNMWSNFSNENREGSSRIMMPGAMVSGPQSVFRGVIYEGGGMEVKVYSGKVTAKGPFEIKKDADSNSVQKPGEEEGGSPEPWQYPITSYQKILVLASGEASQPFRFAAKSDLTDWVRWNQERDSKE